MEEEQNQVEWEIEPNLTIQQLMQEPGFIQAFDTLEKEAFETAATRTFDDDMGRLRAITQVHGIRDLKMQLTAIAKGKPKAKQRARR